MGLIDGKVALVTGAGTGIGREASILLAREGATVVLAGRRIELLEDVAAELLRYRLGIPFSSKGRVFDRLPPPVLYVLLAALMPWMANYGDLVASFER